jgi:biopolymer transport protein ExbD
MRSRFRKSKSEPAELNITAFMNLMVVLVPFLLITAVFSRVAILDLNLPTPSKASSSKQKKQKLQLEIRIYKNRIDVTNGSRGIIKRIKNRKGEYDFNRLSRVLQLIKTQYPKKKDAMILARSDTSYETLVQVMDKVRVASVVQSGSLVRAELFTDISIGDVPGQSRGRRKR